MLLQTVVVCFCNVAYERKPFVNRLHQIKVGFGLADVVAMMSGYYTRQWHGSIMFRPIIYINDLQVAKLLERNGIMAKLFADDDDDDNNNNTSTMFMVLSSC